MSRSDAETGATSVDKMHRRIFSLVHESHWTRCIGSRLAKQAQQV